MSDAVKWGQLWENGRKVTPANLPDRAPGISLFYGEEILMEIK